MYASVSKPLTEGIKSKKELNEVKDGYGNEPKRKT